MFVCCPRRDGTGFLRLESGGDGRGRRRGRCCCARQCAPRLISCPPELHLDSLQVDSAVRGAGALGRDVALASVAMELGLDASVRSLPSCLAHSAWSR